jgi:hypothetical protein
MNNFELSSEFDVLLNSYSTSRPFGIQYNNNSIELDEYEKSVFLTKEQE